MDVAISTETGPQKELSFNGLAYLLAGQRRCLSVSCLGKSHIELEVEVLVLVLQVWALLSLGLGVVVLGWIAG